MSAVRSAVSLVAKTTSLLSGKRTGQPVGTAYVPFGNCLRGPGDVPTARTSSSRTAGRMTFRTWVTAIAYRKALMRIRSNKRIAERNAAMEQEEEAAEGAPGLKLDLERALARLSKDRRAVVSLCFGSGLTHEEAAEALGMALGTVKSHALRGREQLKAYLSGEAQ